MTGFRIKKIEFESSSNWEKISQGKFIRKFGDEAKRYIPNIQMISEWECKDEKVVIEFKKSISINTVNNILSQIKKKYQVVDIEEIE